MATCADSDHQSTDDGDIVRVFLNGLHTQHSGYPIYDSQGARLYPGRRNTPASPMICTSEYHSTAMLEKFVHADAVTPPNEHYIRTTITNGTRYRTFQITDHRGWDVKGENVCKRFGLARVKEQRSAILIVPSNPARLNCHVFINTAYPDATAITHDLPALVWWDERLYS